MSTLPLKTEGRDEGREKRGWRVQRDFVNNAIIKETKERMESKNKAKRYTVAKEREIVGRREGKAWG
jgi:hypothetical protein